MIAITTRKAYSVYDSKGEYIGRLEAYNGNEALYEVEFHTNGEQCLSREDLQGIVDRIETGDYNASE